MTTVGCVHIRRAVVTRVGDGGQPPDHGDAAQRRGFEREEGPSARRRSAAGPWTGRPPRGPAHVCLAEDHGGRRLGVHAPCREAQLGAENSTRRRGRRGRPSRVRRRSPRADAGPAAGRRAPPRRGPPGETWPRHAGPRGSRRRSPPRIPTALRSTPSRRRSFSPAHSPLTELYEVMIPSTPSSTTRRKCARNTSCRVASSAVTSTLEACVLHGVEGVVLGHRHHVGLDAAGQGRAHFAQEHGILTVGLLHPTPRRVAGQVDAHATEEVRPLGAVPRGRWRCPPSPRARDPRSAPRAMVTGKAVERPMTTPRGPSEKRSPGIPRRSTRPIGMGVRLYPLTLKSASPSQNGTSPSSNPSFSGSVS